MSSEDEQRVPDEDLPYYRRATVWGLAKQLQENRLPVAGTKYDLYKTIVDAGLRLFTDDRFDDEDGAHRDSGGDDSQAEDSGANSDEEGSEKPDDGQGRDDQGRGDQTGSNQGGGQGGGGQGGGGQGGGDQGHQPSQTAGIKHPRDSDDDGEGSDDDPDDRGIDGHSPEPRPRNSRRVAGVLPVELQIEIIRYLDPASLWNLITAAPEEYLNSGPEGGINALEVEADDQHALDYPPPPPERSDSGGSDGGGDADNPGGDDGDDSDGNDSDGSDSDDSDTSDSDDNNLNGRDYSDQSDQSEPEYPLSLLEWVGRRAVYDRQFRSSNRTRIMLVLRTYRTRYGQYDPEEGNENPRDDILYYFRPRPDLQAMTIRRTPLGQASWEGRADIVHLLIMHGANVNRVLSGMTPLDWAASTMAECTGIDGTGAISTIFALLGAGADVRLLSPNPQSEGRRTVADQIGDDPDDPEAAWPRIDNYLGLSIREFIADERSMYFDRILLAAYVIWTGVIAYPRFI